MCFQCGSICTGQGNVDKVMAGVKISESGSHVDREVVPFQTILLCGAHFEDVALEE